MEVIKSRELERLFLRPVILPGNREVLLPFCVLNAHIFIAYCRFCNFSYVFTYSNAWLRRKYQVVMLNGKNRHALNISKLRHY